MISTLISKSLKECKFLSEEQLLLLREIHLELQKTNILMKIALDEGIEFPYKKAQILQSTTIDVLDILVSSE